MERIRRPAVYRDRETDSHGRDTDESVSDQSDSADGTQARRRTKALQCGQNLVPCRWRTFGLPGGTPHFVSERVHRSHQRQDEEMGLAQRSSSALNPDSFCVSRSTLNLMT